MERRQYLTAMGAGAVALFAGCTGAEDGNGNGNGGNGDGNGGNGDGNGDDGPSDSDGNGDGDDGNGEGSTDDEENGGETEDVEAAVGSLVEGENLHLVVEDVETTTQIGDFQEADEGNEFVVVTMAMKNVSDEYVSVSNLLQASLRDDEDYSYQQTVAMTDDPSFDGGQFAPGEVERGTIAFEVPEDATGRKLQFDFAVRIIGGIERALIDLEEETTVHTLEQDLGVDVLDVGDSASHGDVSVAVEGVEFVDSLSEYAEPEEGNEYAVVDIAATNDTGEERHISTLVQMMVKDGDGWSYQEDLMASSELERGFDESSPLADGETRRGRLAYQVETDLQPLYWVFEFTLWNDGDKTFWRLR